MSEVPLTTAWVWVPCSAAGCSETSREVAAEMSMFERPNCEVHVVANSVAKKEQLKTV